jgi:hypothetical protein
MNPNFDIPMCTSPNSSISKLVGPQCTGVHFNEQYRSAHVTDHVVENTSRYQLDGLELTSSPVQARPFFLEHF